MAKPEKKKKMQAFLQGKLEFDSNPDGKHESFSIPKKLSIHLPNQLPINLQHGRGDVVPHIVRQIHQFLGLSYKEFVVGKECNIRASVIYRALLWKHFVEFFTLYTGNRATYSTIVEQYLVSTASSLKIITSEFDCNSLNRHERAVAQRISKQAEEMEASILEWETLFDGQAKSFSVELIKSF